MSIRRGSALALLLGGLAVAGAGCGGGSGSPGVANLGTDANTTSRSAGPPPTSSGPGTASGSGSGGSVQMMLTGGQNGLKFSRCMRSHGVSNFPDPNGEGQIQIGPSSGIDPRSSTFQTAMQACRSLVRGKPPSPAQQAKAKQEALAFSACMRKHGIADYPDPTFHGGGVQMSIQSKPGSDLNPNSPTFQAAQRACGGFGPKGKPTFAPPGGGK